MKDRILVVDDDPGIRRTLERILGQPYDVVAVGDAEEAMAAVARDDFHVALVDVHLDANGDGYDLCSRIKAATPDTDVILITGSVSQPDQKLYRSLEEGAYYFLFKPFERRVLRALVDRCLDLQRERRAKESYAQALAEDLAQARAFQQSLLPRRGIEAGGWRIAGHYRPCDALGGDFYYWLVERDGSIVFGLADIVGHGVSAAMYAGMLRSTLDAARRIDPDPGPTIQEVLRGADFFEGGRYASLFYGRLFPDGRMRYVNAGHPAALHVASDGLIESLPATGLFITSTFRDPPREAREIQIKPGSALVVYTDGVTEALNPTEQEFGTRRLEQASRSCRGMRPEATVDQLLARVDAHRDGRPLGDDATVLVVERVG